MKKDALANLRNSWGKAVFILLFTCGVHLSFLLLEQFLRTFLHIDFLSGGGKLDLYRGTLEVGTPFVVMTAFFTLVGFVITVPLHYGVMKWYFRQVSGDSPTFSTIFDCYRSIRCFLGSLVLKLVIAVRILGAGMLVFLPSAAIFMSIRYMSGYDSSGAVLARLLLVPLFCLITLTAALFLFAFSMRYFLAEYLFVSTQKGVSECLKLSIRGMKGNISIALSFSLSFFPWLLLTPLLIPCLFIYPYMQVAFATYAKWLITKLKQIS